MVAGMRSRESKASSENPDTFASDLDFPIFDEPLLDPWPRKMAWEDAVRSFAPTREYYMLHFDSPEKRLRDKNPEPFRLT